jgi:hypothetical protein
MKIHYRKVKPVKLYATCDKCNINYPMTQSLRYGTTIPAIYTYFCKNCGHHENSSEDYPKVEYR